MISSRTLFQYLNFPYVIVMLGNLQNFMGTAGALPREVLYSKLVVAEIRNSSTVSVYGRMSVR